MPGKSPLGRVWLWAPPLAYMLLIFYLSAQSNPLPVLTENVWDKAIHAMEYAVLGVLFYRAFLGEGCPPVLAFAFAIAATSLYGGSDEWHQLFTPGRSSDIHDWFADTLGGMLGIVAYLVATTQWLRARSRPDSRMSINTASRRTRRLPR